MPPLTRGKLCQEEKLSYKNFQQQRENQESRKNPPPHINLTWER